MRSAIKPGLYLASTMLAVLSAPAFAQDGEGASQGVNEIIVTAQRKGESVLDVPLSIQATSGEDLLSSGIKQMSDLQLTTPGFATSNASGYNQMFIRGIGNSIFVGADPSVATFIDEVPRVFGSMVNNFVDVERVEVIKGAPGALYGRNATGGAVNIITRQPSTEAAAGTFRVGYGEKETFQASAYVNLPLSEQFATSFTFERRSHDGYIKNITPDASIYTPAMFPGGSVFGTAEQTAAIMNSGLVAKDSYVTEDFTAVAGKLLFRPSDRFKITIAGDYSVKDDDNGNGLYNITQDYALMVLEGFFENPQFGLGINTDQALMAPLRTPAPGKFETAQRGRGYVKLRDYGVSGTAVLSLDGVDITSITAYRENHSEFLTELGFLPFNMLAAQVNIAKSTVYQELRAVSTGEGPLSWIAGGSYLQAKFDGGLVSNILTPLVMNVPSGSGRYTVTNWSAYLQVGYDITENLNLMASGRFVSEKNDAISFNPIAMTQDPFLLKEEKFLPAVTLQYNLVGGGNVYARWARGFKAGGIVPVVPTSFFPDPLTQGGAFKGETVDSYEVGIRAPLMDRRVQLTAAVFYNDYRDVQVAAHVSPTFQFAPLVSISVVNAGSARTYGAELGVTARVADPLTINASVGYLNAKYKTFRLAANPVLDAFDLSGTRMINSPEWQLSFGADLEQPVSENWKIVGNALVSYTDEILWQVSGLPGFIPDAVGPDYWLVNARLGMRTANDQFELAVYAKNLFNSAYTTFGNSSSSYGTILAWGDPRIVGVEATLKF